MLRILPIILVLFSFQALAQSQPDSLKALQFSGRVGLNFSNVSLTNWAGGGQESVSGTGQLGLNLNYIKDKIDWKSSFEAAYGLIKQGDIPVIKSDDQLILTSGFNYVIKPKWEYSTIMTFRSQFAPGFDPAEVQQDSTKISDWLAPGYFQIATGIDYKPTKYLSFFLSPATYKLTLVMDQGLADAGAYGVEGAVTRVDPNDSTNLIIVTPGKNVRHEIGGSFRFHFKKEVVKNVDFESILDLFSNYLDNPDAIDVNWVNTINMKINDFMTASILTNLIYDQDIKIANEDGVAAARTQFKSVLGIGVSYKF